MGPTWKNAANYPFSFPLNHEPISTFRLRPHRSHLRPAWPPLVMASPDRCRLRCPCLARHHCHGKPGTQRRAWYYCQCYWAWPWRSPRSPWWARRMAATNTARILVVVVLHASLLLQVVLLLLRDWHMLLLPTFSLCFTLYLASSKSLLLLCSHAPIFF